MFVRLPEAGRVKTRLAPAVTPVAAASLYRAFVEDLCERLSPSFRMTIACTPTSQAPYFASLAARYGTARIEQGDGDLGARMERVAEGVLADVRRVVIIGSDAPTIPRAFVARAFRLLRRHSVVLGPSLDGGYYLVGLRKPIVPIFARMRWGDDAVLVRTLRRLVRAHVDHGLLPCWYDVDVPADLELLRRHLAVLGSHGEQPCPRTLRTLRSIARSARLGSA